MAGAGARLFDLVTLLFSYVKCLPMHLVTVKSEVLFQALADPIRLRIVRVLSLRGEESCLCELVDTLHEPQYKLSKHLKILKQAGLLTAEKEGRFVYHRLVKGPEYLESIYKAVRTLPDPDRTFKNDLKRFRERMGLREDGRCRVGIQTRELATGSEP